MPRILAKGDNLNELNRNFSQARLGNPVFLNSVPKCGTHLMRNIMRMFVPVEQQYHRAFIQLPLLAANKAAFSAAEPCLSWGHLLFTDDSAIALRRVRHVVLVRDPFDWVLARTRFFLSDTFRGNVEHLKGGAVSTEEMLNLMILGIYNKVPPMQEIFLHNAVAWMGTNALIVRFEELTRALRALDSPAAADWFGALFDHCGMPLPGDWRERVVVGADRRQSGTARENLQGAASDLPVELPAMQKKLVEHAAPGLRALLGYG